MLFMLGGCHAPSCTDALHIASLQRQTDCPLKYAAHNARVWSLFCFRAGLEEVTQMTRMHAWGSRGALAPGHRTCRSCPEQLLALHWTLAQSHICREHNGIGCVRRRRTGGNRFKRPIWSVAQHVLHDPLQQLTQQQKTEKS